ncbi:MAG: CapA family protein [Cyanobacteriota bacterium]|nr:CapA family protein [Cyanobacteriota bacterium]
MNQQNILELAKQGNPNAIATLVEKALGKKGITAKAGLEKNCLHLLLEAPQLLDAQACIRVIERGMQRLKPRSIEAIAVYGRRLGQHSPDWTRPISFDKPTPPPRETPISVTPENIETNSEFVDVEPNFVPDEAQKSPDFTPLEELPKTTIEIEEDNIHLNESESETEADQLHSRQTYRPENPSNATPDITTKSVFSQFKQKLKKLKQPSESQEQTDYRGWLIVSCIGLVIIPFTGFLIGYQKYRLSAINSTISSQESSEINKDLSADNYQELLASSSFGNSVNNSDYTANSKSDSDVFQLSEFTGSPLQAQANTNNNVITIKAVGDVILGSNYPDNNIPSDGSILFQSVKPLLGNADILFGNFESTLTDYPYTVKNVGGGAVYAFRTPPSFTRYLQDAGFDILNIANNHSYDFDDKGFEDTMTNINSLGMQAVGKKGQIVYKEVNGITVAFIGFSNYDFHNSILDFEGTRRIIKQADEKADIIVISIHAGAEGTAALHIRNETEYFYGENRGNKVLFAEVAIKAGADLILAHGPHVPRALELYDGKLIAYSLGNFVGYETLSTQGEKGYSLVLEVRLNSQGDFMSGKIHPVRLNISGIPYPDTEGKSISLIRYLTQSDFPNTPLEIDVDGNIYKR